MWPMFTAGLVALVIAFALSYLFLNKLRVAANADVQKMFNSKGVKSDIYSMGILMYELLTGSVPFKGDNAVEML